MVRSHLLSTRIDKASTQRRGDSVQIIFVLTTLHNLIYPTARIQILHSELAITDISWDPSSQG